MWIVIFLCIICFYLEQWITEKIHMYIWRSYVWTVIQGIQWYKIIINVNRICTYLQHKICFMNYSCMYIAKIFYFIKRKNPMKYNVASTTTFCSTPHKIFIFKFTFDLIKLLLSIKNATVLLSMLLSPCLLFWVVYCFPVFYK